jgi:hypothetical protein
METRAKKRNRTLTESSGGPDEAPAVLPSPKRRTTTSKRSSTSLEKPMDVDILANGTEQPQGQAAADNVSVEAAMRKQDDLSVEEMALYDRQIRLWGLEAQNKYVACRLL